MILINRNRCVGVKGFRYFNYLNNKLLFISEFHSSVCLFGDNNIEGRLEKLTENINIGKDISLSKSEEESLREGLSKLKTSFSESEVSEEISKIKNYFENSNSVVSSFDEAFPNYVVKSDLLEGSVDSKGVFFITDEISKEIKKCINSGTMNSDCIDKINLSSIIRKVMSNDNVSSDSIQISEEVGTVVRDELINKNIYERIGDITLRDIYENYNKLNENFNLNINPNYKEIGFNLVSYGLLLKSYNKFVYNRPIPTNVVGEELKVIKTTRQFSRFWFTGLVAPLLLFSFYKIREKGSYVNVNVNLPEVTSSSTTDNTTKNNGLLLLLTQKVNTLFPKVPKGWWVIIFIIIILILWKFDGKSLIYYIKDLKKDMYIYYLKYFLLFIILVPIVINVITLYFLGKKEKNGEINILKKNIFSSILNRYIYYINIIGKNKELLSYYKSRCQAELGFYVFILILYFYFFV